MKMLARKFIKFYCVHFETQNLNVKAQSLRSSAFEGYATLIWHILGDSSIIVHHKLFLNITPGVTVS